VISVLRSNAIHYDHSISTCEQNVSTCVVTKAKPGTDPGVHKLANLRTIKPVSVTSIKELLDKCNTRIAIKGDYVE